MAWHPLYSSSAPSQPHQHPILSATLAGSGPPPTTSTRGVGKSSSFSIASLVGRSEGEEARNCSPSPPPVKQCRSPSPLADRISDSPSPPPNERWNDSPSPPPCSPPSSSPYSLPLPPTGLPNPQAYLDQLVQLKAIYEARGVGGTSLPPIPSGVPTLPGLPPALHPGLHRPLVGQALPPFLGGMGGHPALPPSMPREYPLHPWFVNRHRFPPGKAVFS